MLYRFDNGSSPLRGPINTLVLAQVSKQNTTKPVSETAKTFYDTLRLDNPDDELQVRILEHLFNTLQHVADGVVTICLSVRQSARLPAVLTLPPAAAVIYRAGRRARREQQHQLFTGMIHVFIESSDSCSFFCCPG